MKFRKILHENFFSATCITYPKKLHSMMGDPLRPEEKVNEIYCNLKTPTHVSINVY
jgi:hypothetical protein